MKFITYLPYDWKTTERSFVDHYSSIVNKKLIYCIPADSAIDFIVGSLSIRPVCPEQLVMFEINRFYLIDKIQHYLSLQGDKYPALIDSYKLLEKFQDAKDILPNDLFKMYYQDMDKTKLEFLVPKNRISPICTIDISPRVDKLFEQVQDINWQELKRKYVNDGIDDYYKHVEGQKDLPRDRCIRNIEAVCCFDNFITNQTIVDCANELYGTDIDMEDFDRDVYWKLHDRLNEKPSSHALKKLITYIKKTINGN